MLQLLISTSLGCFVLAQGGHHHEYRKYVCLQKQDAPNGTDCTLTLKKKRDDTSPEFKAAVNQDCFEEIGSVGKSILCPLYCPETGAAYAIWKNPSHNHKCVNFHTYKAVNRDGEWFLWRTGECLNQAMTFEIGCHFLIPADQADVESFLKSK